MAALSTRILLLLVAALGIGCQATGDTSHAESGRELRVVTSGGFATAYRKLAPGFEAQTGIRLVTEYGASTGGAPDSIPVRLERGEQFDVVILSRPALDRLTERGDIVAESRTDLVRSLIGMAVRKGRSVPDISTPEAFVAALYAAESIAYSASVSGTYLATDLWPRLGIWKVLEPKSRRIVSERVADVVARGDVEIGFQQVSEILPAEGIVFAGPIPAAHQKVTTFSTGIATHSRNADDARRLIEFLASVEVAETVAETGLSPVALED